MSTYQNHTPLTDPFWVGDPYDYDNYVPSVHKLFGWGIGFGQNVTTAVVDGLIHNLTIEFPTVSDDVSYFYTEIEMTVETLAQSVRGTGSPALTPDIRFDSVRSASGTPLFNNPQPVASVSGAEITSFDNPTIPADSYVWVEIDSVSGTVSEYFASMKVGV